MEEKNNNFLIPKVDPFTLSNSLMVAISILIMAVVSTIKLNETGQIVFDASIYKSVGFWIFWAIKSLAYIAFLSGLKNLAHKRGLKDEALSKLEKEYDSLIMEDLASIEHPPISYKQWISRGTIKSLPFKLAGLLIVAIPFDQMITGSITLENVISWLITMATWLIFGLLSFNDAYQFTVNELPKWYAYQIRRIRNEQTIKKEQKLDDNQQDL